MDSSLPEVWQAAAGSPFLPAIGKGTQFSVGFVLLLLGVIITAAFALSELIPYRLAGQLLPSEPD
jgi:cell cycle checkpoint protein